MSRSTVFWDRFVLLLLAALLVVVGLLGLAWGAQTWPHLPATFDVSGTHSLVSAGWWPWALLVAGLVLVLVGLRWLLAHLRSSRVGRLTLPGSDSANRLGVDAGSVASAAADELADTMGVRSARGRIERDRGSLVAHLTATVEGYVSLDTLSARADEVSEQLASVLERPDLRCLVEVRVATRSPFPGRSRGQRLS